jgi:hypothetical protein
MAHGREKKGGANDCRRKREREEEGRVVKLLEDRSSRSHPSSCSSYLPHVPRSPCLSDQMPAAASQVDMPAGAAGIFNAPGSFISAADAAGVV